MAPNTHHDQLCSFGVLSTACYTPFSALRFARADSSVASAFQLPTTTTAPTPTLTLVLAPTPAAQIALHVNRHEEKLSLCPVIDLSLRDHHEPVIINHASQRIQHQLMPLPPPYSQLQYTSFLLQRSKRQFAEQPQHFPLSVFDRGSLTTFASSAALHPTQINSSLPGTAVSASDSTSSAAHYAFQHGLPAQNFTCGSCSTHSYLVSHSTVHHVVYYTDKIRLVAFSVRFDQHQHPTLAVQTALSETSAGTTTVQQV